MDQLTRLHPDPAADALAGEMLERDDVHRTILEETIDSATDGRAKESGRTVCGTARAPLPPLLRRWGRISLPTCPISTAGAWHTHVTVPELLNPENSLADMANVAFQTYDVSIVAGAETSHVVMAAEDRMRMQDVFVDELGVDAATTGDVVDAVLTGEISDPVGVRRSIQDRFGTGLVFRVDTPTPDLAEEIRALDLDHPFAMPAPGVGACPMYHLYAAEQREHFGIEHMDRFRDRARGCQHGLHQAKDAVQSEVDISSILIGEVVGQVAGRTVENLLFR